MNVIEVSNLTKRYGDRPAVDGVSFAVEEGEILAILGPNGAGKTTTVESVSGLRTPDSGSISVLGLDPQRDRAELREVLGVQLQESELPAKLNVREALELYAAFYRTPADTETLLEVLTLIAQGETNRGAAARLFISEATVKTHLLHIYEKLEVNDRAAAVAVAYERGLLSPGRH
jgi:ABC-2 type transport system ATP-binding protein